MPPPVLSVGNKAGKDVFPGMLGTQAWPPSGGLVESGVDWSPALKIGVGLRG